MKKKSLLIFLLAAASTLSITAATGCNEGDNSTPAPPVHQEQDHTYGEWYITAPTDKATGVAMRLCTELDGGEQSYVLPVLTDPGYTVTNDTATATEAGTGTYTITIDGVTFSFTAKTPAKGEPEQPKTEYTVHFNLNGHGAAIADAQTVDGKVTKPTDPTDNDYDFGGWYTDAACTTAFDFNTALTAETTIYAKWTAKATEPTPATEYTVHFNINGHGLAISDAQTVDGKVARPTDPTDNDYDFGGWYADAACTISFDFNVVLTAETTIYAKWTAKQTTPDPTPATEYTVHFNLNGHGTAIADAQTVDGKVSKPTDPTDNDYDFGGWYTDADCTTAFDFNTVLTAETTIYAKWTAKQTTPDPTPATEYTVHFNLNGHGATIADATTVDGKITAPTDPTDNDYDFGGWYTDADCTTAFDFNTVLTAETTIYAKWTAKQTTPDPEPVTEYTVHFNLNGHGATIADAQTVDGKITAPTAPTDNDYDFGGWYTDADCTTAFDFNTVLTAETTIYAKWTAKQTTPDPEPVTEYTVHFNLNGHGTAIADATTVDGKVAKPTDPSDENYDFGGWYTDADCTTAFDFNTVLTAETTIYAKWTAKVVDPTPDPDPEPVRTPLFSDDCEGKDGQMISAVNDGITAGIYAEKATENENFTYNAEGKLVQKTNGANFGITISFGAISGDVEGSFEVTPSLMGSSWKIISLRSNGSNVFSVNCSGNNGKLQYILGSGTATDAETADIVAAANTTYSVAYKLVWDGETSQYLLTMTINDKPFVTDFALGVSSVEGFYLISSNSGARVLTLDNIVIYGEVMSASEFAAKTEKKLAAEYAKYTFEDKVENETQIPATHSINGAQVTAAYNAALQAIKEGTQLKDIQKAYEDGVAAMAAVESDSTVKAARASAVEALEAYKSTSFTLAENSTAYQNAVSAGKTAINAATNSADVTAALNNAKTAIDGIKTDDQINAEKLAAAKISAAEALDGYKTEEIAACSEEVRGEIANIISTAKTEIESATSIEAVEEIVSEAKNDIDLKIASGNLESYKEAVKNSLNDYATAEIAKLDNEDDAGLIAAINSAVQAGETAIASAGDNDAVDTELAKAKTAIDALVAADTLAKARSAAKAELSDYATAAKDGIVKNENVKTDIDTEVSNGNAAIETAADTDGVTSALSAAKQAIDDVIDVLKATKYTVSFVTDREEVTIENRDIVYGGVVGAVDESGLADTVMLKGYYADAEFATALDLANVKIYENTVIYVKTAAAILVSNNQAFNYSELPVLDDKTELTQENLTGSNSFLTLVEGGSVQYRTATDGGTSSLKVNCIQISGAALQVTFNGTGSLTIKLRGTGSSAYTAISLKNIVTGECVEATYGSQSDTTVTKYDGNVYCVVSKDHFAMTFNVKQAGDYVICTNTEVTNNGEAVSLTLGGARLSAIVLSDSLKLDNSVGYKLEISGETAVAVEGSVTLTAAVTPEVEYAHTITWTSSDESIATVAGGVVTGVGAGIVTIKATSSLGLSDTVEIEVGNFVESRTAAIAALKSAYPAESYTKEENKSAYESAIAAAEEAIAKTTTKTQLDKAVADAQSALNAIATDENVGKASYTVNFANTSLTEATVYDGEQLAKPADPVKEDGSTFLGWYTDEACTEGNEVIFPLSVTANTTIYAKWQAAAYTSWSIDFTVGAPSSNLTYKDGDTIGENGEITVTTSNSSNWNKSGYFKGAENGEITFEVKADATFTLVCANENSARKYTIKELDGTVVAEQTVDKASHSYNLSAGTYTITFSGGECRFSSFALDY